MRIRVYNDFGTSRLNVTFTLARFAEFGETATSITAQEIRESDEWMNDTDVLVFTSNSAGKFMQALGAQGMDHIRRFVFERGGTYLGICAGAYFGSSIMDFTGADLKCKIGGLELLPVIARGGLEDLMGRPYTGDSDSAAIIEMYDAKTQQKFKSIYWGGPRFLVPKRNHGLSPLFWTLSQDRTESYLMGIHGPSGNAGGHVFLLGNHCEVGQENARKYIAYYTSGQHYDEPLDEKIRSTPPDKWQYGFGRVLEEVRAVYAQNRMIIRPADKIALRA